MARYTLAFVDAYLKHDAVAHAFLKVPPTQNGVPPYVMAKEFRAAIGVPASFDGFRAEVGRQGFERAGDVYAALQKQRQDFKLNQEAINSWSEELIDGNHFAEAIFLLKLCVKIYPHLSGAYTSLARAYEASGQKQLAIENYQTARERDPLNVDAIRKLEELEGGL